MKIRKTLIFTLLSMIFMFLTEGCTSLLDEENIRVPVADMFYATPEGYKSLTNACYPYLRGFYGNYNGWRFNILGTDLWLNGGDGPTSLGRYTPYDPGDGTFWTTWRDMYMGITACNTAIARANGVTGLSEAEINRLLGEAHFLRAVYFHILVMNFGGVPLKVEEVSEVEVTAHRASEAEVYSQIIDDLLKAEQLLPVTQAEYGRATKPAAQALLARVYLWNNQNEEAAVYAKKVINDYDFSLLPDYADLWDIFNQKNSEVIWSVQYTQDTRLNSEGNLGHLVFLMRYDLFRGMVRDIENGRPFRHYMPSRYFLDLLHSNRWRDSRYDKSFTEVWYANRESTLLPEMTLGDTALFVVPYALPQSFKDAKANKYTIFDIDRYFDPNSPNGELTLGPRQHFPSINKFHDPIRPSIPHTPGSRDFFVFRLAEMHLIAAEALMKQNRAEEGVEFINAVRRRAAWPGREADMEITSDQLTIDFILEERALELAAECVGRWPDLKRTGKLIERVKLYNPDARPNLQERHLLRPIPTNMIDRIVNKEDFLQNPGY